MEKSIKYYIIWVSVIFVLVFWGGIASAKNRENRDLKKEINGWNRSISKADRAVKYCKMTAAAFIFYRGTNHLFWADFAHDSRLKQFGNAQTRIWLQGDLHAYNFGAYENSKGELVYGLNDFDEAVIADYQYDVWRMAISLILIARENGKLSVKEQEQALDAFAKSYLNTLTDVQGNNKETATVFSKKNTHGKLNDFLKDVAKKGSRTKMLKKWTQTGDGKRTFDFSLEKLDVPAQKVAANISKAMTAYGETLTGKLKYDAGYFKIKSIARRLMAGTGSLGTQRYYVLIEGSRASLDDDRILDVKQQSQPTPYHYSGKEFQRAYKKYARNDAQRHALAYHALTNFTDDHLGWLQLPAGFYSVRELSPYKESFPAETLTSKTRFIKLAEQWGMILAMSHARADNDSENRLIDYSFEEQVVKLTKDQHGEFQGVVHEIAFEYASQVEADWREFIKTFGKTCSK